MNETHKHHIQQIYAQMIAEHGAGRVFGTAEHVINALRSRPLPNGTFLDVGCGNGAITVEVAHAFPTRYVMGLDLSPDQLAHAHKHNSATNLMYSYGDADELPYLHCAAIYSVAMIQYLENVPSFFRTVFERLHPGGAFWYSTQLLPETEPGRSLMKTVWQQFIRHTPSYFSLNDHRRMLQDAGFEVLQVQVFPSTVAVLTPKRQEILSATLHEAGLTAEQADTGGWVAMGEFYVCKKAP